MTTSTPEVVRHPAHSLPRYKMSSLSCSLSPALAPAFVLSLSIRPAERLIPLPSTQRRPHIAAHAPTVPFPTRVQLARIRFHLLNSRAREAADSERRPDAEHSSNDERRLEAQRRANSERRSEPERKRTYTVAERRSRSDRLKNLWNDPTWRERVLARRSEPDVLRKISAASKAKWQDPEFRERMRLSRLGRAAPNKGKTASKVTRLRMSLARKGVPLSREARKKISETRLKRAPEDNWPRLISQSKKGKTKEYFAMRREFRALHRDLMLWSDSYRTKYGRLPSALTYERFVAPMMILRIRRYLILKEALGDEEPQVRDIMSD